MDPYKIKQERQKHPYASANILSKLSFSWTISLFRKGLQRDLTIDDLPRTLDDHKSTTLGDQFEKAWDREVFKSARSGKEPSLLAVIIRLFGCKILFYGLVIFVTDIVLRVSVPLLLSRLLQYFSQSKVDPDITLQMAYMFAVGLIACQGFVILLCHPYCLGLLHCGMQLRVAMCSLIYRKALKLSKVSSNQTSSGQVINLLSNDSSRFDVSFLFFHNLWVGPVQTVLMTYLLWDLLRSATLIGLTVLLIFIPYNVLFIGKTLTKLRLKTAFRTDDRVRLMNEILNGIQVIKMYTWEKPFAILMDTARKKEIKELRKVWFIRGSISAFLLFHTRTAIFLTILSHFYFVGSIDAVKVFVLSSCYNTLRESMTEFFPLAVTYSAETLTSIKRIKDFLLINENLQKHLTSHANGNIESNGLKSGAPPGYYNQTTEKVENRGIFIKNVTAKWDKELNEDTLSNVTLDVIPGLSTAVIGPIGSGKSSLFHAILRELPLSSGAIQLNGTISYASQEPWLFQGSVRQNILFGLDYNRERYRQVVKVCALKTDFEQLPFGDRTIVGERGVSVSGGQRARIGLARAVYKDADIYLLDDPLSAVDAHVGKHLFEDCIKGFLKKKVVLLITHQLQYIAGADQIVLLENGRVSARGNFSTLQEAKLDFTKLFENEGKDIEKKVPAPQKSESSIQIRSHPIQAFGSIKSIQSIASSTYDESLRDFPAEVSETQASGKMSTKVYKRYFDAAGGWYKVLGVLTLAILAQLCATACDYWIAYWVNLEEYVYNKGNNSLSSGSAADVTPQYLFVPTRNVCVYVYSALIGITIIVACLRTYTFFSRTMEASITLHNKMFISVSRATMWFFNNNTSGRILNRFSKDMGIIDELLPASLGDVIHIAIDELAIIIVVASVNPFLLIPTLIIAFICYLLAKVYVSTARSIKRLEGMTKSPVFTHANASISGLTTIRAFKAEKILTREFDNYQDINSSAWFLYISTGRALAYWVDLMCLLYVAIVTLSFLVVKGSYQGDVGLAITQTIGLTGNLQWVVRQLSEIENEMTSVERVHQYSTLQSEPGLESLPDKKPQATWPEDGKIEFSHVRLRYGSDPWVLKDLCFTILPQQKIGIVGRTGAGKSSLISAIFRLTEIEGALIIDGINTSTIGLHDLRSKLSIIPQEPILFTGTMRKNLDPFDEHNDDILWSALEKVELKEVVSELPGGLQGLIAEGGSNLSLGQRQLICLARAIVRNNKILVLDEATANVDLQTDTFIQQTIRNKFAQCTVITVAHRLNTVMDSDKILVMEDGNAAEYDHPHILLQNSNGLLYKMVERTGKNTADTLTKIAAENYLMKHPETAQQENTM